MCRFCDYPDQQYHRHVQISSQAKAEVSNYRLPDELPVAPRDTQPSPYLAPKEGVNPSPWMKRKALSLYTVDTASPTDFEYPSKVRYRKTRAGDYKPWFIEKPNLQSREQVTNYDRNRMYAWLSRPEYEMVRWAIYWDSGNAPGVGKLLPNWSFASSLSSSQETTELLTYMAVIEKIYVYHGVIKKLSSVFSSPLLPPRLPAFELSNYHVDSILNERTGNFEAGKDGKTIQTNRRIKNARTLYLIYTAHSLVLEMYSLLDWSILDYADGKEPDLSKKLMNLKVILGSESFFQYSDARRIGFGKTLPSDPTRIFLWMLKEKKWVLDPNRAKRPAKPSKITDSDKRLEIRNKSRDSVWIYFSSTFRHEGPGMRSYQTPTDANAVIRKKNGVLWRTEIDKKLYHPVDYKRELYWGTLRAPTLAMLLRGYAIPFTDYEVTFQRVVYPWIQRNPVPSFLFFPKKIKKSKVYPAHRFRLLDGYLGTHLPLQDNQYTRVS